MVEPRLAQQRQAERGREVAGQRLGLVVEVDQQRLVEAGLDEAVGVAVVAGVELLAGEVAGDVLGQHLGLEVRDRAGLRGRQVGRVAEREDVRLRRRLQRALVGGDEAERVAEPGRALDVGGAAVQRDRDEQVEVELAAVVGGELAADAVDLAGVELGHELDLLLGEQARRGARRRSAS